MVGVATVFGMLVMSGASLSAQTLTGKVVGVTGSGQLTAKVGNMITGGLHQVASDNKAQGLKAGVKYGLITVYAGAEKKGQQADIVLDLAANQNGVPGLKVTDNVAKADPAAVTIMVNDKVEWNVEGKTLTFSRGGKVVGKIMTK